MARIEKILEKNGKKLIVNDYLPKSWIEQDKEGNDRYTTEIKGQNFQFLGGGTQGGSQPRDGQQADSRDDGSQPDAPKQESLDDDIPF